ncbi:putative glutamine amidotransferase class-I [Rosellinia necatrix]|uniref:Putative glutamine amidotransferase class-I n=1 Tax=Rosellinia necatrix TaxID=77044 RepID=A0A1W2TI74_ROSNE|nr:putative glutamine amidotransferase class-I [Rosellinia necatrix]
MSSLQPPAPLRLAILVTDEPLPGIREKLGQFDAIFTTLLRAACQSLDPPQALESELEISAHDVVAGDPETVYPDPATIDAVLITGSRHSAYSNDEWVLRLTAYTRLLLEEGRVRVIGVCFGHQIAARALGAQVTPSSRGWELSVTELELTNEGKRVFGTESLAIYQTHRDAVLEYPKGIESLAQSKQCPTQSMYIPGRLLTVQGHPEYSPFIMSEMLRVRHRAGAIPRRAFTDAMLRATNKHNGIDIARAFLRFLRE